MSHHAENYGPPEPIAKLVRVWSHEFGMYVYDAVYGSLEDARIWSESERRYVVYDQAGVMP